MLPDLRRFKLIALILVLTTTLNLSILAWQISASSGSTAQAAGAPLVRVQTLNVTCAGASTFTNTYYTKVDDIGTFTVENPNSIVEIVFNGRIAVGTFDSGSTGARFELRVDNAASTVGRARANLRPADAGINGRQASITGIFTGLNAGEHTVSIWVQGIHGGGTNAYVDPSCYSTDHVVIKEYVPFGSGYLPAVTKN